jgi:hypothetical protein
VEGRGGEGEENEEDGGRRTDGRTARRRAGAVCPDHAPPAVRFSLVMRAR